jgi:hypothetical protein
MVDIVVVEMWELKWQVFLGFHTMRETKPKAMALDSPRHYFRKERWPKTF